jgi:hypothetical protein
VAYFNSAGLKNAIVVVTNKTSLTNLSEQVSVTVCMQPLVKPSPNRKLAKELVDKWVIAYYF